MSYRAEIAAMLKKMPSDWRRQYNIGRRHLERNTGIVLPDVPTPEQAMEIVRNMANGKKDPDQPLGKNPVPQDVRDEAMHGLRLSYKNNYGAWEIFGIARAIQLALAPAVPDRTRERMQRYLSDHAKDKAGRNFGNEERPSNGYMAWLNWGGDAGKEWVAEVPRATYGQFARKPKPNPARRKTVADPGHGAGVDMRRNSSESVRISGLVNIVEQFRNEPLYGRAAREFTDLLRGEEYEVVGSGGARIVVGLGPTLVAKVDMDPDAVANNSEADFYRWNKDHTDLLNTVIASHAGGRILVMPRAQRVFEMGVPRKYRRLVDEGKEEIANLPYAHDRVDHEHDFNWGLVNGVVQLLDYNT